MPELPEMETYRSLLFQKVALKPITTVEVNREKTINVQPDEFTSHLLNQQIHQITRRGKHLVFWLDSGEVLLLHLMLGGSMYYGSEVDQPNRQSQVVLSFEGGHSLFFIGLRLGYLHLYTPGNLAKKLEDLGPEPLDSSFTEEHFTQVLRSRRGPLKTALVNQHCIAGIGNCYADEICFQAGILPLRKIPDLDASAFHRLYQAMHSALQRAISYGGYMEHPFYLGDKLTGGYNEHCLVYDRGGEPCHNCHGPITQTEHARRKVFYCGNCQH